MILNQTFGKGATFTPSVSQNGDLSWTNDGGLPNPETVNIQGPVGPRGADGKPGKDGAPGPAGPGFSNLEQKTFTILRDNRTLSGTLDKAANFIIGYYAADDSIFFLIPGSTQGMNGNIMSVDSGGKSFSFQRERADYSYSLKVWGFS